MMQQTVIPSQNILVVDDNPKNLHLLVGILAAEGYEIRPASDAEFALQAAFTRAPDLILLDIMMPGMDGYSLCEALKQDKRTRDIPIIFISALQDIDDKVKSFRLGGVDYIPKPFQAEEVLARVKVHLMLRQREQELIAANKRLNDFAYVVSHDLKAPLRGVTQLVTWLVSDYPETFDAKGHEMAELLKQQVRSMEHLIGGILSYFKNGGAKTESISFSVETLVREVLELLLLPEHIQVAIASPLPTIVANKAGFHQVFQNLLDNAVKFHDKPVGHITIACSDDGAQWIFQIADNGPGITPEQQEKIFELFQSFSPAKNGEKNSGIGLATVKKIIERHGGRIWVESEPGQGSSFFFTLPKHQMSPEEGNIHRESAEQN